MLNVKSSLSLKLFKYLTFIYLTGTISYGWVLGYIQSEEILRTAVKEKSIYIDAIKLSIKPYIMQYNISGIEKILEQYITLHGFDSITLTNTNNKIQAQLVKVDGKVISSSNYGDLFILNEKTAEYFKSEKHVLKIGLDPIAYLYFDLNYLNEKELKNSIIISYIEFSFVTFTVLFVLIYISLQYLLKPLGYIADFATYFSDNLGKKLDIKTDIEEIDKLVQAINWSSENLKKQEDIQLKFNSELESKIHIRTKELEKSKIAAEVANKEKTQFLSRMSHELRTPLNAVLGFSQILVLKPDNLSKEQIEYVDEIKNSGNHLLRLINNMLDIGQLESGALRCFLEPINLAKYLNTLKSEFDPGYKLRLNQLILPADISTDIYINADRKFLNRVLFNLISNAINHSGTKLPIHLNIDVINDEKIKFSIVDKGVGIDQQYFDKVFDRFVNFNNQYHVEGLGIGLHLAKNLVVSMGGEIGFESIKDVETTFWFELKKV